jgi:uncharacterized protein involved in response to NO
MGGLIAVAVATWFVLPPIVLSVLYALAAAAHLVRLLLWEPLKTRGNPLLWMLPATYLVLQAAAVARVFAMIAPAHIYNALVTVSGGAWILAFGLYLVHYGPMLIRPRNDGRAG